MAETSSPRRYYLHKRIAARQGLTEDLETVWQAKQEAEAGTALAATFPHRAALVAVGYSTAEDLDGADVEELRRAGFTIRQAQEIIGALS